MNELMGYIKDNMRSRFSVNLEKLVKLVGTEEQIVLDRSKLDGYIEDVMATEGYSERVALNVGQNMLLIDWISSKNKENEKGEKMDKVYNIDGVELRVKGDNMPLHRVCELLEGDFEANKELMSFLPKAMHGYWLANKKKNENNSKLSGMLKGLSKEEKEALKGML